MVTYNKSIAFVKLGNKVNHIISITWAHQFGEKAKGTKT